MNKKDFISVIFFIAGFTLNLQGQNKQDYQWIMGYDYSQLPDQIISLNFNYCPAFISHINTVSNFWMEGSNTSMSDGNGNLLFYSNGCYIVNAEGFIMENGDSINPGLVQELYCPGGGSPYVQGVISIPAPESDSLFYVFNLDMGLPYWLQDTFLGIAPERLYYQLIDMGQANGLGKVVAKNQIAAQDTFARANIQAVRHANGIDWWLITPKSHSNCYFMTLVTAQGVQPSFLECEGKIWSDNDVSGQAVFTPDASMYIRFNADNGLNIFNFDNQTGELSDPVVIEFPPSDTFYLGGASVSQNSRFLYTSARKKLYQFDLQSQDIASSKILIGEWDGFANPYATIFYLSALAPDGKIYISSTSSHLNLHVIHHPDSLGLACGLEQHGIELPSYNFATIPNFPHYRSQPTVNGCNIYAFEQVICEGDSTLFNGEVLYETGIYTANLTSSNGADSIIELRLEVVPTVMVEINATICEGQFYLHGNDTLTVSGAYTYHYDIPPLGCDSVVGINLTVIPPYPLTHVFLEVIEGSIHNGIEINMDTIIIDTLVGQFVCDSIVNYYYSVIPNATDDLAPGFCFEMYPNPTSGLVSINFTRIEPGLHIEVYDLLGRVTLKRRVEQMNEVIDIRDFTDGAYIINIKSDKIRARKGKIIKMK